jgi:hypothetical protein
MKSKQLSLLLLLSTLPSVAAPLGEPGSAATYRPATRLKGSVVQFTLALGPEEPGGLQWVRLTAEKADPGARFQVWVLRNPSGSRIVRYLLQEGGANGKTREYRHELTGDAVLPSLGGWEHLWPRPEPPNSTSGFFAPRVQYIGHIYALAGTTRVEWVSPPNVQVVNLRPDLWLGPPSNTRQKDETRRYDGSDYELVALTQADYRQMADAGITCVKAVGEQQAWAEDLGLYYWGPLDKLPYPELLYRSQYLGPRLFLDEPAVTTRDHVLRPRMAKDPQYRTSMNPREALRAYQEHYAKAISDGPPQVLMKDLAARPDVVLGAMQFAQQNIYNWETMVSTAAWALSQDPNVPSAMVFEPPGRIGTRRTLPEFNMSYGTQFPVDDMRVLPSIAFGFLRGAARLNAKQWGVSIYGAVERADTFWWMTRAYDMGATRFFFWDNYQLACVPFGEILSLSRHLRAHARQHPRLDLANLRAAAGRAILLPPGYDLGHVQMGRGNLWGIAELNLERLNRKGVKHRSVMSRFFAEIERSLQQGVSFDLLWDLPGLRLDQYREVVRVREDGEVEGSAGAPSRAGGVGPELSVTVTGLKVTARVKQTTAPVYYTFGADPAGVLHNAMVLCELYGPAEEDYLFLMAKDMRPRVRQIGDGEAEIEIDMPPLAPGAYRLRAATVDVAGRSTVVWREFRIDGANPAAR